MTGAVLLDRAAREAVDPDAVDQATLEAAVTDALELAAAWQAPDAEILERAGMWSRRCGQEQLDTVVTGWAGEADPTPRAAAAATFLSGYWRFADDVDPRALRWIEELAVAPPDTPGAAAAVSALHGALLSEDLVLAEPQRRRLVALVAGRLREMQRLGVHPGMVALLQFYR